MRADRIARKAAVALLGDEFFEHANPAAFARLQSMRSKRRLNEYIRTVFTEEIKASLYTEMPLLKSLMKGI